MILQKPDYCNKAKAILLERGQDYGNIIDIQRKYHIIKTELYEFAEWYIDGDRDNGLEHTDKSDTCLLIMDMIALKLARLDYKEKEDTIIDIYGYLLLYKKQVTKAEMRKLLITVNNTFSELSSVLLTQLKPSVYETFKLAVHEVYYEG